MEGQYDKKTDATPLMVAKSCFSCAGKTKPYELNKADGNLFVNYQLLFFKIS